MLAREPAPVWVAVWRFRLLSLLLLGLLVVGGVLAFRQVTGASAQDPGIGAPPVPAGGTLWTRGAVSSGV